MPGGRDGKLNVMRCGSSWLPGYTRPRVELFTGSVDTGCGPATSDVGPFYCPVDQTAYFDTDFFEVLRTDFGSTGGPLAEEYVVAHEFGHHVQNLQGTLGRAQQGAQGPTGSGVRTELQADCYAGVWAHYAAITKQEGTDVPYLEPLSDQDIADALSAAAAVGDDRIQQAATGYVNPESWTHGSSEQRRSGSPSGTRPVTRTSATPSQRAILGRRATAVDAVAEDYLATFAALDPCAATEMGITGHDDDITDYSPDGVAARADAARTALRELDGVTPEDDVDVVTLAAMRERLGVQIELHDAELDVGELNVIASPLQIDARCVRPDGHRHRRRLVSRSAGDCRGCPTGSRTTPPRCERLWTRGIRPRSGRWAVESNKQARSSSC